MSTASALPETLKSITATKFQELKQQRDNFEISKARIHTAEANADGPIAAAEVLLDGIKTLRNINLQDDEDTDPENDGNFTRSSTNLARQLYNQRQLLRQAKVDPSVPLAVAVDIQESLQHTLKRESLRHEHAYFFSTLVTEWLSNSGEETHSEDSAMFEKLGRKEMHEQRAIWESLVFSPYKINTVKLNDYLYKVFLTEKAASLAYTQILKDTKQFSRTLWDQKDVFNVEDLPNILNGLLNSDILSADKTAILRTFLDNKEVLKEIVDVLNMRYASLSKWNWTTIAGKGIPIEMRRQLNGKYRVFMDEDVLDAILLYEIGLRWSVHFKSVFTQFFNSIGWKRRDTSIPKKDLARRKFFLASENASRAPPQHIVAQIRRNTYAKDFFLAQLPVDRDAGKRNYDEDNEDVENYSCAKSPLALKHGLLHLLVAESIIAQELHPESTFTVVRSDFKWFGPALPHDSIFTVLKFFGLSENWITFFHKFLEAPLHFVHDGAGAETRIRRRGVPLSHTLSDVLGEAVLFVMDTAVNQATSSYLYRLHDDFWLWGAKEVCLTGWQAMNLFASATGIEFNREKTGTVHFVGGLSDESYNGNVSPLTTEAGDTAFSSSTPSLPGGEIRWGFLKLDANLGRFIVDQAQVDTHIEELKTQLASRKSIFSYVQAYNAYAGRFFTNNFGKPSYGFGYEHIDMMIDTFARIQKALFPQGSITDYLASIVAQRFGVTDLPQGFWYWPIKQGGLELSNPLIPLLGMRNSLRQSVSRMLGKAHDGEEKEYYCQRQRFEDHGGHFGPPNPELSREIDNTGEDFLTKEEYFRYREERSPFLGALYTKLLEVPSSEALEITLETQVLAGRSGSSSQWDMGNLWTSNGKLTTYWSWLIAMYSREIVDRYGSVRIVDAEQIPVGIVSIMQKSKVRWSG